MKLDCGLPAARLLLIGNYFSRDYVHLRAGQFMTKHLLIDILISGNILCIKG